MIECVDTVCQELQALKEAIKSDKNTVMEHLHLPLQSSVLVDSLICQ